MNNKYGLIANSLILKDADASFGFRALTRKNYEEIKQTADEKTAINEISNNILNNIEVTCDTIDHCRTIGADHYRLNNSLFGLIQDPTFDIDLDDLPKADLIKSKLTEIGKTAITKGVSLSVHLDSFCKINDDDSAVVEKTVREVNFWPNTLTAIGLQENYSCPIVSHVSNQPKSGGHDDLVGFVDQFFENFKKLDDGAQKRLAIKNDDNGEWNCLNLFKYFHVYCYEQHDHAFALSYDNLHDSFNISKMGDAIVEPQINIGAFHETWKGVVPVFNWSEPKSSESKSPAKTISGPIPDFNYQIKWELEFLDKDYSIVKILKPEEDKVTEEIIKKITRKKYTSVSDVYNRLYEKK